MNIGKKTKPFKLNKFRFYLPLCKAKILYKFYTTWFSKYGTFNKKMIYKKFIYMCKFFFKKIYNPLIMYIFSRFLVDLWLVKVTWGWVKPYIMLYFTVVSEEKFIYKSFKLLFKEQKKERIFTKLKNFLVKLNTKNSPIVYNYLYNIYYDGLYDLAYTHYRWMNLRVRKKKKEKKKKKKLVVKRLILCIYCLI